MPTSLASNPDSKNKCFTVFCPALLRLPLRMLHPDLDSATFENWRRSLGMYQGVLRVDVPA